MYSPKGKITKEDVKSIVRGLFITLIGAGLAYLLPLIESIDWAQFGKYAPLATVVGALATNMIRKYLSGTMYTK